MDNTFRDVDLDGSEEEEETDDEEASLIDGDERKASTESKRAWDSFRDIPPKQDSGSLAQIDFIEQSKRVLKFLAYVITFSVVLCAGALAKALVLLMTSQLNPPAQQYACVSNEITATFSPVNEERVLWTWVLFFVFCVPEFGVLVRAGRIVFFKNNKLPELLHFCFVFAMESFHVIGVAILVFEVLPQLDAIRGALLTNAVCLVPGILRMLSRDKTEPYSNYKLFADGAAILMQLSAFFVWPIADNNSRLGLIAPALLLTSCGWWMNFIPHHPPKTKGIISEFLKFLCSVRVGINNDTMYWVYLILCLWKVVLFFCFMLIIVQIQGNFDVRTFFDLTPAAFSVHNIVAQQSAIIAPRTLVIFAKELFIIESSELGWLWIGIVQAFCAYACYAFAKFACKILIQKFSMSFANVLTVPGTIVLLVVFHEYRNGEEGDLCFLTEAIPSYMYWNISIDANYIADKCAWIWVLWLISQIWISLHIWFPKCERLARTEKLFATPMFSSILIDQSVCLNRTVDEEIVIVEEDIEDDDCVPHVIVCATMWHESKEEMIEMLKAIVRLDNDQCARRVARTTGSVASRTNYYTFEAHILFDDVFEVESEGEDSYILNQFVRDLLKALPQAVREVHRSNRIKVAAPEKIPTPYGGRLVYTLPGDTKMNVHLKDKNKIRHRKRWSQCMYMYYLLGFRLMDRPISTARKEKIAHNTFLLALDGDIDFQPKAVLLLVDLMKKNDNLGAACGRIHPVGSGLMAWYQTFEYAIGHWLQKATEHMIGCVLCSPGCFSLFRGSALMDDNVMKTYTKNCEAASDYVQYDQGEDRWLCTLLLQRGYRVEYSAASDAYTHCPETFNEFYNQRRRWVPSTMANILDLLGSYKQTIKINSNISLPYIFYQTMLMAGTVLGPGTIFLMLVGAFVAAFKIDNWTSFIYNLIPIIVYIGICLFLSSKIQLGAALIISTVYALVMMAVLVGILIQIYEDGPLAPSTLFLFVVAGEMIVAALMHPEELHCLPSGAIYYVTIPSMYLLLIIYSVCNLNIVSWGTREVATKKTKAELEEERKAATETQSKKKKGDGNAILSFLESFSPTNMKETGSIDFSFAGLFRCMLCTQPQDFDEKEHLLRIGDSLVGVKNRLDNIEKMIDPNATAPHSRRQSRRRTTVSMNPGIPLGAAMEINNAIIDEEESKDEDEDPNKIERDDLLNPYWIEDDCLKKGKVNFLPTEETKFWKEMIGRYLTPIDEDKNKKKKLEGDLRDLRDKMVLAFFMLNALFVTVIFLLQLNKDIIYINWPLGVKSNITYDPLSHEVEVTQQFLQLEPIGLTFVLFFALILIIQFTGMFLHRFETLCHVLSVTDMFPSKESVGGVNEKIDAAKKEAYKINESDKTEQMLDVEPVNRRKTVQIIEAEMKSDERKSVRLEDTYKKFFIKQQDEERLEAERRQSSGGNRFSRRFSGLARNSMASKRVTMSQTNPAFATITEDEKEEV